MKPSALLWYGIRKPFEDEQTPTAAASPRSLSDAPCRRRTPRAIGSAITQRTAGGRSVWTRVRRARFHGEIFSFHGDAAPLSCCFRCSNIYIPR